MGYSRGWSIRKDTGNLADLELDKERLLAKLQSWERWDKTMGCPPRPRKDISRFMAEL